MLPNGASEASAGKTKEAHRSHEARAEYDRRDHCLQKSCVDPTIPFAVMNFM
jgi:hypothetical protein